MNTQKNAPTRGAKSKQNKYPTIDFERIAAAALAAVQSVLDRWLPNGKRQGSEWICANPTRSDGRPGSFSINMRTGMWADFATDDSGGDLISLIAYLDRCNHQSEAAESLAKHLGIPLVEGHNPAPTAGQQRQTKPTQEPERPILPIPAAAIAAKPTGHPAHGKPSHVWQYHDAAGGLLFEVWRFDSAGKRKQFSPLTYWRPGEWKWKSVSAPRPLYGLDRLAARPEDPVLIAEGEKAADAAGGLLPSFVCIATLNGAQSPDKSDFSPLRGRIVRVWPDADEPGQKYARAAARLALEAGAASVELLDLPALAVNPITRAPWELPKGWDAADAIGRGWNPDNLAPALQWLALKPTPGMASTTPKPATPGPGAGLPEGFELIDRTDAKGRRAGLFFVQHKNRTSGGPDNGPHQTTERLWLADPCRVTFATRDATGNDWGKTLEFEDADGESHRVILSLALLAGSGESLRALLLGHGLAITTSSEGRRRFMDFLLHTMPTARARSTSKTGHQPGGAFVLPGRTIGGETVFFQSEADAPAFTERGTLSEWQESVSRFASGNPLMLFSLSLAFAAPLLALGNGEGAIFHLLGKSIESSTGGKSSLARLAVSVCGAPELFRLWRTTDNALEAVAEAHNDLLLTLDEIGQLDPKTTSDAIYLLTNGRGKQRAGRTGEARAIKTWRLFVLSTGEVSAEVHMSEAAGGNRKHKAGHGVRFIELIADAGAGMGAWADLHGHADPASFAKTLTDNAAKFHGTALDAWLRCVIERRDELPAKIREWQAGFVNQALQGITDPAATVRRVCEKFGLVAVAGELATEAGITAWNPGEARAAAADLFAGWLRQRGGAGNTQERALIEQVRSFLALHGEARFSDYARAKAGDDHAPRTANRAGFMLRYRTSDTADGTTQNLTPTILDDENGGRVPARSEFYVFREVFRSEIVAGFDYREAESVLIKAGILLPGKDRVMQKPRLPGFKNSPRVYVLTLDEPSEAHA